MSKLSKALQAASVSEDTSVYVEDLFGTVLYNGNGANVNKVTGGLKLMTNSVPSYKQITGWDADDFYEDSSGNLYSTYPSGSSGGSVTKYSSAGVVQWSKTLEVDCFYGDVEVDSNGDVIVARTKVSTDETQIYKFSGSDGSVLWKRRITNTGALQGDLCLRVYGTRIFVVTSGTTSDYHGVVLEINSSTGAIVTSLANSITYGVYHKAIAIDAINEKMYVCGYNGGSTGASVGHIIKFDISGTLTQSDQVNGRFDTYGDTYFYEIAVDPSGDVYVVGAVGNDKNVVSKFTGTTLSHSWSQFFEDDGSSTTTGVGYSSIAASDTGQILARIGWESLIIPSSTYNAQLVSFNPSNGAVLSNSVVNNAQVDYRPNRWIKYLNGRFLVPTQTTSVAFIPDSIANGQLTGESSNNLIATATFNIKSNQSSPASNVGEADLSFTPANNSASDLTISNTDSYEGTDGGLVWIKNRLSATASRDHQLFDTNRGTDNTNGSAIASNTNAADTTGGLKSFNSNGFTVGLDPKVNTNNDELVSWAFRQYPQFFKVIQYVGDGNPGRVFTHDFGSTVGMVIVKNLQSSANWNVWHRSATSNLCLNTYGEEASTDATFTGAIRTVTDTTFTMVAGGGGQASVNALNDRYVAYIFGHNDGDANFGISGDQDIIKCGTYTGNGSSVQANPIIDLGFEPQWLLIKNKTQVSSLAHWIIIDNIRRFNINGNVEYMQPDGVSLRGSNSYVRLKPNGFQPISSDERVNASGQEYIYVAIRRPMRALDNVGDLFEMTNAVGGVASPVYISSFPVDFAFRRNIPITESWGVSDRSSQDEELYFDTAGNYNSNSGNRFYYMNGWREAGDSSNTQAWMWRRSRGFLDITSYLGNGVSGLTVNHNLGVVPEMVWIKSITGTTNNWAVYHKDLDSTAPENYYVQINQTNTVQGPSTSFWNGTKPTNTQITLGSDLVQNTNGNVYIGYLFASIPGIAKVGSYVGNGGSQNINCGFSNGASLILIRSASTSVNSNWLLFDTRRGLNNEISLSLNTTQVNNGEVASYSGGFALNNTNSANKNGNGTTYIFYAIAAP